MIFIILLKYAHILFSRFKKISHQQDFIISEASSKLDSALLHPAWPLGFMTDKVVPGFSSII